MKQSALLVTVLAVINFTICGVVEAKRVAAPDVAPVYYRGIKFIAPNTSQRMGYIEALNLATGQKVWEKKVYSVMINPLMEKDVQYVFITSLKIKNGKLIIKNEKNKVYKIIIPPDILKNLYQIRYNSNPAHPFSIGTKTAFSLSELKNIIIDYMRNNPGGYYEFYSEYKLTPEEAREIRNAIRRAGVKLEHFWVPVSNINPDAEPGPYGAGIIDIE